MATFYLADFEGTTAWAIPWAKSEQLDRIKLRIQSITGCPVCVQTLVWNDEILLDQKFPADDGAILYLLDQRKAHERSECLCVFV